MNETLIKAAAAYLIIINLISAAVTIADKMRSKRAGARRIPEKVLFTLSFLGGAAGMYITMKKIRHKTRHKRFMIGIPLIILLHAATAVLLYIIYIKFGDAA